MLPPQAPQQVAEVAPAVRVPSWASYYQGLGFTVPKGSFEASYKGLGLRVSGFGIPVRRNSRAL